MKRILVPTDFSDCANAATEMAFHLAKQSGADIYFLHLAIDRDSPPSVPGQPIHHAYPELAQARTNLDQLVKAAEVDGIRAKQELVIGTGQEKIQDFIAPYRIDYLVMGSHGATGIREAIIGSKTQHVIRHIKIPCLVVKFMPAKVKIKNILFASNFKKDSRDALKVVIDFSKNWQSQLHLLFVNFIGHLIDDKVARLMMTKQMEDFSNVSYTLNVTETNDKEFGISQFAKEIDADIISVAMKSKGLVGRLFNPSMAEQLINHSPLPVLVVNSKINFLNH